MVWGFHLGGLRISSLLFIKKLADHTLRRLVELLCTENFLNVNSKR